MTEIEIETFRQQLDETERLAKEALEAEAYITLTLTAKPPSDQPARALVEHYRRHGQPDATLRWVAAAREILAAHRIDDCATTGCYGHCPTCNHAKWPCPTVRALMSVYPEPS